MYVVLVSEIVTPDTFHKLMENACYTYSVCDSLNISDWSLENGKLLTFNKHEKFIHSYSTISYFHIILWEKVPFLSTIFCNQNNYKKSNFSHVRNVKHLIIDQQVSIYVPD